MNELGDVIPKTDPLGAVWKYSFDGRGNLCAATDPLGVRDDKGLRGRKNLLSETNAIGAGGLLKQWKQGTTVYRELRSRGLSERGAAKMVFGA